MTKTTLSSPAFLSGAALALASLLSAQAGAAGTTSVSVGADFARGDYGTPDTTNTFAIPVAVKHENGPWTFRASMPYVRAEGTFNREVGAELDDDDNVNTVTASRTESGLGDLTVGAFYNLINNPGGYSVDVGGKAKIATANKNKTLITTGENDFSAQVDVFRELPNVALFATLGYTIKGDPAGVNLKNPFYTALGFSVPLATGRAIGAAWDYRQKVTTNGDPVNELTGFYSMRLDPKNKMQFYVVKGISDGSPDFGGGVVFTHTY